MLNFVRVFYTIILPLSVFSQIAVSYPLTVKGAIDIVAVQQVINLFAIAVDQHRWDLLTQVFDPNVSANFDSPGGAILHGLNAVVQALQILEDIPSFHQQSASFVNYTNPRAPHASTYLTGVFLRAGATQEPMSIVYGRYDMQNALSLRLDNDKDTKIQV